MKLSTNDVNTDQQLTEEYFYFFLCRKIIKNDFHLSLYDLANKIKIKNKKRPKHPHKEGKNLQNP